MEEINNAEMDIVSVSSFKSEDNVDESSNSSFKNRHEKPSRTKRKMNSSSSKNSDETSSNKFSDRDILEHKLNEQHQKRKKRNESHAYKSNSSVKKINTKKKQGKDKKDDPIVNVVDKPRENYTKYEDPIPFPELTTNTIYVQNKNGFRAMKINDNFKQLQEMHETECTSTSNLSSVKITEIFYKFWFSSGLIYQGLLGGISLIHFIFLKIYINDFKDAIHKYSLFSEIYTSVFSFLVVLSIISIFDKCILVYKQDYPRKKAKYLFFTLVILLYIIIFLLHQVTSKFDDKLILMQYNHANSTSYHKYQQTRNYVNVDELKKWQTITSWKDILATLNWILICISIRDNLISKHQKDIQK